MQCAQQPVLQHPRSASAMTKQGSKATRIHFITTFCTSEWWLNDSKERQVGCKTELPLRQLMLCPHLLYPLHGSHFASGS
eukprot:scaffold8664_cov143-Skeletonema_marinoi.AAC.12